METESQTDLAASYDAELGEDEIDGAQRNHTQQPSHRKRQQNAIFDAWYRKEAAATDFSSVKTSRHKGDQQEQETIKELLKKRHGRKIIGSEYAFQTELFERAKSQNTIVVADTGVGKTLIAINLLKHVMDQEINARANGNARKIAFFVVSCCWFSRAHKPLIAKGRQSRPYVSAGRLTQGKSTFRGCRDMRLHQSASLGYEEMVGRLR